MIRKIVFNGKKHNVDKSNVLGSGGEATVVNVDNWAVKIYHANQLNATRTNKLKDFLSAKFLLPSTVLAPEHLVFDNGGSRIIGYAMRRLPKTAEVVQQLSTKSYRRKHPNITNQFIVDLFLSAHSTIEALHKQGIIVGDFNDLNSMFRASKSIMALIDSDSFQFGKYPCMVGTENFLDPALYNQHLSQRPLFEKQHDWYAYFVMLFRSLLLTHPYGGTHKDYKTLPQRAIARVPVFGTGVRYPKPAVNYDVLSDDLQQLAVKMFQQGERFILPVDMLEGYRDSLAICNSCGIQFPSERSSCPQCATINRQQIQRATRVVKAPGKRTVEAEELIVTTGRLVWHKIYHKTVIAIANENNTYWYYEKHPDRRVRKLELFPFKTAHFDIFAGRYLVVNFENSADINIYDLSGYKPNLVAVRPAEANGYSCSQEHLFRIQGARLYRGYYESVLKQFVEKKELDIIENQSWIAGNPSGNSAFLFQRFFETMYLSVLKFSEDRLSQSEIKLPDFDPQESILDMNVLFAATSLAILIKTEIKGKTYTRVFVIYQKDGSIIDQYRVEALSSDTLRRIWGKAFAKPSGSKGILIHPVDDGIVQETIGGKQVLISEAEPFVSESDYLHHYHQGLLVVRDQSIDYLTMK